MSDKKAKETSKFVSMASGQDQFGKAKPTRISFEILRAVKDANPLVNVICETLKHMVVKIPYEISVKEEVEEENNDYKSYIKYLKDVIDRPNPVDTRRTFLIKLLDDVLGIDRGVVEIVKNPKGMIAELWQVDGATVKPRFDDTGVPLSPAFVQTMDQEVVASFENDEIKVLMNSPVGQINMNGYGKSPVERILLTILTSQQAENFNAKTFTSDTLPPYYVNLPGATEEQVAQFKNQWESNSRGDKFKGLFTNISEDGLSVIKLKESNRDMQYFELTLWTARLIVASFEMSPQDIGLTMDVNRATGEVQERNTKNQGLRNMLDLIEEFYNGMIKDLAKIDPNFENLEYRTADLDKLDEKTQAEIDQMYINMGKVLPEELRKRDGMPEFTPEQLEKLKPKENPVLQGLFKQEDDTEEETEDETETKVQKSTDQFQFWYGY